MEEIKTEMLSPENYADEELKERNVAKCPGSADELTVMKTEVTEESYDCDKSENEPEPLQVPELVVCKYENEAQLNTVEEKPAVKRRAQRGNVTKRKAFSIEEKMRVIELIERGEKTSHVSRRLGLRNSTTRNIWKNREKLRAAYSSRDNKTFKRIRNARYDALDGALLEWFKRQRGANAVVNRNALQSKAEHLVRRLKISNFACLSSWIDRFKKRHNIAFGKPGDNEKDAKHKVRSLEKIRHRFRDEDIFVGDETGLFYKMPPQPSLKAKRCAGRRLRKERVTLFVCTNLSGNEKRELVVIGKSKNPRCFKNVKKLPVKYRASEKARMTSEIFEQEIRRWDEELTKTTRKIALVLKNSTSHPNMANLTNVRLVFLRSDTVNVLQPMCQGVIRSLKSQYRRNLTLEVLQKSISDEDRKFEDVSLLDACRLLYEAWNGVGSNFIRYCLKYTELASHRNEKEDGLSLGEWLQQYSIPDELDDDVVTAEDTDNDAGKKESSEEEDSIDKEIQLPTVSDSLRHIKQLITFYQACSDSNDTILKNLYDVEYDLEKRFIDTNSKQ